MMSNGRRVPRNGATAPPRGPRPEGYRGYAGDYDQMGAGSRAAHSACARMKGDLTIAETPSFGRLRIHDLSSRN